MATKPGVPNAVLIVMNNPTTCLRECSCLKLLVAGLFAAALFAGATPTPVEARPPVEFGVGWGVTRMEWLAFDETVSHVQVTADVGINSWISLQLAYFNSGTGVERFVAPGFFSIGPDTLFLRSQALKLGAVFTWRPVPWVDLYAKPALSYNWSRRRLRGGTEFFDPRDFFGRTSTAFHFAPAVGGKFRVFPRLLLGAEYERSKIWRTDSDSYTFSVIVPW